MAVLFVTAGLGYGAILTLVGVIAEELAYHRYHSWRDFALLVYAAVAECAGYRQLHAWWRLRGMAGAVLRHGAAPVAEPAEPGAEGESEPAFGAPARGRHVPVRENTRPIAASLDGRAHRGTARQGSCPWNPRRLPRWIRR